MEAIYTFNVSCSYTLTNVRDPPTGTFLDVQRTQSIWHSIFETNVLYERFE